MASYLSLTILLVALTTNAMAMYLVPNILNPSNQHISTVLFCRDTNQQGRANLIECQSGEMLQITDAIYGIKDHDNCPFVSGNNATTANQDCDENTISFQIVKDQCQNEESCEIDLQALNFPQYCPNEAFQGLQVKFTCLSITLPLHPFANSKGTRYGDEMFKGRKSRTRTFTP
jgi:hypothetical protein